MQSICDICEVVIESRLQKCSTFLRLRKVGILNLLNSEKKVCVFLMWHPAYMLLLRYAKRGVFLTLKQMLKGFQ